MGLVYIQNSGVTFIVDLFNDMDSEKNVTTQTLYGYEMDYSVFIFVS